jgi:hypothetical protein
MKINYHPIYSIELLLGNLKKSSLGSVNIFVNHVALIAVSLMIISTSASAFEEGFFKEGAKFDCRSEVGVMAYVSDGYWIWGELEAGNFTFNVRGDFLVLDTDEVLGETEFKITSQSLTLITAKGRFGVFNLNMLTRNFTYATASVISAQMMGGKCNNY